MLPALQLQPPSAMTPSRSDFVALFREHAQALLVSFERRVVDPELATDLVAATFTAAIAQRERFGERPEESLIDWLWRIGRETLVEHLHAVGNETADAIMPAHPPRRALSAGEVDEIERLAEIEQLRRAALRHLAELPPRLRDPVRLRIVHQCSYEEIAQRLLVTSAQARVDVWQGLTEIVDRLEQEERQP